MPQFYYKARDELGRMVKGVELAEDEDRLISALRNKNLYLVSASEKSEKRGQSLSLFQQKMRRRDIIDFLSSLATILSAGIPILEGLEDMAAERKGTKFGKIISMIKEDIQGGSLLCEALSRHPQAFGETYIHLVRAGEASGNVDIVLRELATFLEWQEELVSTIKKITIYPIMVLLGIGGLITFVFAFALPKIMPILIEMKVDLPLTTRIMIKFSKLIQSYWYFLGLGLMGGIMGVFLISQNEKVRMGIDRLKLRLPMIGDLLRKIYLSRFSRHLGLLLEGGIGIFDALIAVEGVVGNLVISNAVKEVRDQVQAGLTFTEALRRTGEFPPRVLRMISIGESTGTLGNALTKVSKYYDEEVPATVKKLLSAAEPALIIFLAMIVMGVGLSIYLPIYQGIGRIGK